MKIKLTAQIKQHAGDILLECQDSFNYNLENKAFSVSDGVSQAYRPELWSRILTDAYVQQPEIFFTEEGTSKRVNPQLGLKDKWSVEEHDEYVKATSQEQFLLDLKKKAINMGAATFIGVQLVENGILYHTIGDSVLFFYDYETKGLNIISSMIPENGDIVFNNSPEYIDSNECNHGKIISGVLPYREGILIMATDALSDWIVERRDLDIESVLHELMGFANHEQYDNFVDSIRNNSLPTKLKDDDTTFVALEFSDVEDDNIDLEIGCATKFNDLWPFDLIVEIKNKSEEIDKLQSANSKSDRDLKKKEKDYNQLDANYKKILNSETPKDLEITNLKAQLAENERSDASANKALTELRDEVKRLKSENVRLKHENSKVARNKLSSGSKTAPNDDDKRKIMELERVQLSLESEIEELTGQLATYQNHLSKIKCTYDKYQKLDIHDFMKFFELALVPLDNEQHTEIIVIGTQTNDGGFSM